MYSVVYPLSLSAALTEFKKINTLSHNTSIHLPTSHLEANATLRMEFKSTVTDDFVNQIEGKEMFLRDTATVTIVRGNYKYR